MTRERKLRTLVVLCAAIVVTDFVIGNVVVDDFSTVSSWWWFLAVPVGLLFVGSMGIVAAVLLVKNRRRARRLDTRVT